MQYSYLPPTGKSTSCHIFLISLALNQIRMRLDGGTTQCCSINAGFDGVSDLGKSQDEMAHYAKNGMKSLAILSDDVFLLALVG